jgi:hypothetical protein
MQRLAVDRRKASIREKSRKIDFLFVIVLQFAISFA